MAKMVDKETSRIDSFNLSQQIVWTNQSKTKFMGNPFLLFINIILAIQRTYFIHHSPSVPLINHDNNPHSITVWWYPFACSGIVTTATTPPTFHGLLRHLFSSWRNSLLPWTASLLCLCRGSCLVRVQVADIKRNGFTFIWCLEIKQHSGRLNML